MGVLGLAFGPERARVVGTGLLCGVLMMSFGFEGPILAHGVTAASAGMDRPDLALGLLVVTVAYVWAGMTTVRRVTENLLIAVMMGRRRLIETTLRSDLATMERAGAETVLARVTVAPADILATAPLLARGFRTACYIVGALVVLASLAWQLFAVMAGLLLIVAVTLGLNHQPVMQALGRAGELEAAMGKDLRALVTGFKELRLNAARRRVVLAGLHRRADAMLSAMSEANRRQALGFVLQASATLAASGACVFVVPNLMPDVNPVMMITAAVLISNISLALIRDIPLLARGEAAIGNMEEIHAMLRPARVSDQPVPPSAARSGALVLNGVCYHYPDADDERGFAFGPVDLGFQPGTVSFVLGSNSSGKTTLLKLLAGLYEPTFGEIRLGGDEVLGGVLRESVSAIFAEPYIFDRLYGWADADPVMVNRLLADMGLAGRTRFVDGRFTSVDLSTGQRKRLAWVVAMIEARPILLLDQWAADQDPDFREHFYRVLLPGLRAAGRTVIAVTNDDRYYDTADRLIRLNDGVVAA